MKDKTFKELVLIKYPKASASTVKLRCPGCADIIQISNEENNFYLGSGNTEGEAWADAYLKEVKQ